MSGTLNKVMLIGHLGDEVKMHYFEGGGCVGRFPLATNETYVSKQTNERVTNTDWHNIVVRNKAAEICEKYLTKGDKVYVEGRIKTRKWQDESGNDRYSTEIQVSDFTFLSTKRDPEAAPVTPAVQQQQAPKTDIPKQTSSASSEDDLPF
ncbi:single-stranded DNA-binding protein [Olleya sp. Ti.3.14]|uniref:single-stranded DNA-binding protein n=1 Tax=Olleya sp. Ti.3.14 TaxID=3121297 RepID=UPI00311D4940